MNWLFLNSLKKRYTAFTLVLALMMLAFNWLVQNQINEITENIQANISSRNILFQRNRQIRNTIGQFRDVLHKFQIDPRQIKDQQYILSIVSQAILSAERLAIHPWIKANYSSTVSELILVIHDFENISQRLIKLRLTPSKLFPSLEIANSTLQPLAASFVENINLTIKDIEDNYSPELKTEYQLFVALRYQWAQMISDFRMYMLNQLSTFQEIFINNQLNLITDRQTIIKEKLSKLSMLYQQKKLGFGASAAIEDIIQSGHAWMHSYKDVIKINQSGEWRTDTVIFQKELEPKLEKVTSLLRILDHAIEQYSDSDIKSLSITARRQVTTLWTATFVGLFILMVGFIYLIKLILNPIAAVTHALKNESKGIETNIQPDISVLETKDLVTAFSDMRKQIHSRQTELEYHALHDSLTGLANRDLLNERIQQAIHNAQQERNTFAILIMDLDRFKEVNDTLGHSIGDILLQHVAQRLSGILRETDVIARLGGDEFSILLSMAHKEDAEIITKKILNDFNNSFMVQDLSLFIGISIGISIYPEHGVSTQTLLQRADIAMYEAKRNKTGYEFYDAKYDEHSIGKLSLISDIRTAIDKNQLFMEYQPIIDIKTGAVVSAEALIRWNHPLRGKVYPDEIIPIAEQTGLINPITYWIIDTTAKYSKRLSNIGINIKIAINLSVYNLQESNFVEKIISILKENEVSASNFIMEITESVMMTNPKKSIDILNKLDQLNIEIAVDDFGTGYSSLTYLKRLPLSKLKIDKTFIMDMNNDENDALIVRSTIDLAHNLGMQVIAEGIEEEDSIELLAILGCELGQGYFISRPISDENFEQWVIKRNKG